MNTTTEKLTFAQRFAASLFHAGLLSGERGGFTTPETIMDAAAEVMEAAGLTSEDVQAWFTAKRDEAGVPGLAVGFDTDYGATGPFTASHRLTVGSQFAPTLDAAIAELKMVGPSAAKAKREKAAKLLAEAEQLEAVS